MTSPVNVDVKLGVNKFNVDEEHPHIVVKADADKQALIPFTFHEIKRINLFPFVDIYLFSFYH